MHSLTVVFNQRTGSAESLVRSSLRVLDTRPTGVVVDGLNRADLAGYTVGSLISQAIQYHGLEISSIDPHGATWVVTLEDNTLRGAIDLYDSAEW
jgi:hypothetical protein